MQHGGNIHRGPQEDWAVHGPWSESLQIVRTQWGNSPTMLGVLEKTRTGSVTFDSNVAIES